MMMEQKGMNFRRRFRHHNKKYWSLQLCLWLIILSLLLSCLCHHSGVNGIAYQDIPINSPPRPDYGVFINDNDSNNNNNNSIDASKKWKEQIATNRQFLTRKGRASLARSKSKLKSHQQQSSRRTRTRTRTNRIRGKQQYQQQKQQQQKQEQRLLQADSSGPILNVLVCLMQWTNHPTRNEAIPASDYEKLFNGDGRDPTLYPGGTVSDWFKTMSYGDFQINFEVTDWIMTDYTEQQFTADGSQGRTQELQEAFIPVLDYLDNDFFDFGAFDANIDRQIDLTVFVHSGYEGVIGEPDCETGATSMERIASHARSGADLSTWLSSDGYVLGPYAVVPAFRDNCDLQIGRIGPIIHEMIHTFGLPEMYDVEGGYGTGNIGGIDRFGVMANTAGNSGGDIAWPGHIGAWSRMELGWVDPIVIDKDGTYEIRPVEQYPDIYKITEGFSNPKEYLLIENRQPIEGDFDEKFFTPGGILIYHVDENIWDEFKSPGPKGNFPRGGPFVADWPGNGKHYPVAILQADGLYELEQGINGGQSADLWNQPTQVLGPGNGEKIANTADYPNTDSYAFGDIITTGLTIRNFQMKPGGEKIMTFQVCGLDSDDCPDGLPDTKPPTEAPTVTPTITPTKAPTNAPDLPQTSPPTVTPTKTPTKAPTVTPTKAPTNAPDLPQTLIPTDQPQLITTQPTKQPTKAPTNSPIVVSTASPTRETITESPSKGPIGDNIFQPPSGSPVSNPSDRPSVTPQVELLSNGNCDIAANAYSPSTSAKEISNITDGENYEICDGTERQGVWYKIEAGTIPPYEVVQANTCFAETNVVNSISVFRGGNCSALECIETESMSCKNGELGQVVYWSAEPEEEDYYVFVHSVDNADADAEDNADVNKPGDGSLFLNVLNFPQVLNDDCSAAVTTSTDGAVISGVTEGARPETNTTDTTPCGIESAGVWYKVTGTGSSLRATTCLTGTNHPTQIHVFSGSCGSLSCISVEAKNYAVCSNIDIAANSATVNWWSEEGIEYFVLVSSRDGSVGDFELQVTEFDPVANDQCSDAIDFSLGSQISGSTMDATNDFPYDGEYCGLPLETAGVWYEIEGTGDGISFSTCAGNDYDSAISIFMGSDCDNLQCVTGVATLDPSCNYAGVTAAWLSQTNETYYVYVHGSALNSYGSFEVVAEEFVVVEPNEFCQQALPVTEKESFIQGSTEDAIHAAPTNACGVEIVNPGLWYTIEGTGYPYEISACARDNTDTFDVSVSLFSGDTCGELNCVSGYTFTDEFCSTGGVGSSINVRFLQNSSDSLGSISLDSEEGATYYVYVHGQDPSSLENGNSTTGVGGFDLIIRSLVPPTRAPTQVPTTLPKEEENDSSSKSENSSMNLNYLYLLLLLLLILLPVWFFRKKLCCCLPCFKDKDGRDTSKPADEDETKFRFGAPETPFQDENLPGANKRGISVDLESDEDSDDDVENREIAPPLAWQTLN